MLGSMAALELPGEPWRLGDRQAFVKLLYERYRIEAPVQVWNERWLIRPSCHIYNRAEEYERLADAVLELLG